MKRKIILGAIALFSLTQTFAQKGDEVTAKNSWLKAGLSAGVPVGDLSDYSSVTAGLELSGQFMVTKNIGLGVASGYTHYFAKNNAEDFGAIPLGLLVRYYPQAEGFFAGVDGGYSFLTNVSGNSGGAYVKPQLGYHNYSWNFYGFYNHIFQNKGGSDLQSVGVAATYNLRFNKSK